MSTTFHVQISVRDYLDSSPAEIRRAMKSMSYQGRPFKDVSEFRHAMMDLIADGVECLPIGKACEGWDPKTGCPGHPTFPVESVAQSDVCEGDEAAAAHVGPGERGDTSGATDYL